ncbi:MAG TPA: hypothetical protein GXX75_05745 [Clostridiales bacterium]|nr:hypothetical protein [Clostridiales bacterium]
MSYSIVNEELRIQSCSIEDLVDKEIEDPATVSLFYDPSEDMLILNSNREDADVYLMISRIYLKADKSRRPEIRKDVESTMKSLSTTLDLLDKVIWMREQNARFEQLERNFSMIGRQKAFYDQMDMIYAIDDFEHESTFKLIDAYNWGYIQGVKAERARRKKVSQ